MMMVLVGVLIEISENGWTSPSGLSFLFVAGCIVLSGLFHPEEVFNLFCGPVYFAAIPSMYMLLMIYSLTNMNDISWGTRESSSDQPVKKKSTILSKFGFSKNEQQHKYSIPGLCDIICFPQKEQEHTERINLQIRERDLQIRERGAVYGQS